MSFIDTLNIAFVISIFIAQHYLQFLSFEMVTTHFHLEAAHLRIIPTTFSNECSFAKYQKS